MDHNRPGRRPRGASDRPAPSGDRVPWPCAPGGRDRWAIAVPCGNRIVGHADVPPDEPIANHLRPGDVVDDPFLGSGTTRIAAERCGCRGYAMEIDPLYVEVALARRERCHWRGGGAR